MAQKIAIIAGAGPAGLTAAYELLQRTDIIPLIFEKSEDIGGISKTVNYKGNRIDIGGHRFFSKSDRVMEWWLNILPLEKTGNTNFSIQYQNKTKAIDSGHYHTIDEAESDKVMLVRKRLSRIYFLKKFFSYPVTLSMETLGNLGLIRSIKIFFSFLAAKIKPLKPEKSLEDFFINRFGKELYKTFFRDYTEKVWGIPCNKISPEWGAQRVKGLSVAKAIMHALSIRKKPSNGISQKETETSLIERFLYPKFGPGQMWEEVANRITNKGGKIFMQQEVVAVNTENNLIRSVRVRNNITKEETEFECQYFFSTMPVKQLINAFYPKAPEPISAIANGLMYRDFLTVGLLMKKLKIKKYKDRPAGAKNMVEDNWIYIQEREVQVGRLQVFNNWSPFMVADPENTWIGMEYFCNEDDMLWKMDDEKIKQFAIDELAAIDIIHKEDVLDSAVLRMEKAYPAYFGTYDHFDTIKTYTDTFENLFLVGRNGMHKYNNSDHSMLTAMVAVDNIISGIRHKTNIWEINTEQEYHESNEEPEK